MFLLCGLGNKGSEYSYTRHNMGYMVVDRYSERYNIPVNKKRYGCRAGVGDNLVLAKPDTYMNISGPPVATVIRKMGIEPDHFILVHDDLDMDFGRVRIRWNGGHGGHRGVLSIVESLRSRDFYRVKMGIGRSPYMEPEEYVLSRFSRGDSEILNECIDRAVDAIHMFIFEGKEKAMSLFNRT